MKKKKKKHFPSIENENIIKELHNLFPSKPYQSSPNTLTESVQPKPMTIPAVQHLTPIFCAQNAQNQNWCSTQLCCLSQSSQFRFQEINTPQL